MINLMITLYAPEKSENGAQELVGDLLSKLDDGRISYGLHVINDEDGFKIELDTSKYSKKAPQSVLKAVSDSLDRVYSDGSKLEKNEECSRAAYIPYEPKSYFNKVRAMYGLPELDLSNLNLFPDIC